MSSSSLTSLVSEGTASSCNLTFKMFSPDKCPRCRIQYDFFKRVNVTKIPLILHCKHTVCEDCIRKMCLANKTICPVCKEQFSVERADFDCLSKIFQPHFTLIGQLVWAKNSLAPRKEMSWVSTGQTLNGRQLGGPDVIDLTDESEEISDPEIDREILSFLFKKCEDHPSEYLNLFCENCNSNFCCDCFIEKHAGHKATYLYKLTEQEQADLQQYKKDLEIILLQLQTSKKQIRNLKTFDVSDIEQDIKNYFNHLHAKLHVAERNITKNLLEMEIENIGFGNIKETINTSLYKIRQILSHFSLINSKQLNVRALFETLRDVRQMPCKLVSEQGIMRPIEFLADNVFDNLEDTILLKNIPGLEFNLLAIQDWDDAYEDAIMKESFNYIKVKPEVPKISRVSNSNETPIRVIVTHINSLDSFFIQKYSTINNLRDMNMQIGRRSRRRNDLGHFRIGGIYGVLFPTRNATHWRRAKLLDIIKSNSNQSRFKFYFTDYGNTTVTTRDRMKELDTHTIKRPPFAYECKLTNPEQIQYDKNAHLKLPQILAQNEVYVQFMDQRNSRNSIREVDLLVVTSNGEFISVREFLNDSVTPELKQNFLSTELKLFKNSKTFSIGQEEKVIVAYVRDPHYICIQLAQNKKILQKLRSEMQFHYQNYPFLSTIPVVNSDVVVKYEDAIYGNWHRATVTEVCVNTKEANVFFVDLGRSALVSWSDLKPLSESFIKVESQGIIAKLAHVEKRNIEGEWAPETIQFLCDYFVHSEREFKMIVNRDNPLEVALFEVTPSADICINSLLVERNLAVTTGNLSETVYWPTISDPSSEEDNDLSFQMIKKCEEILMQTDDVDASGLRVPVEVLNFESPDLIYIKYNRFKDSEDERQKELQIHYSSTKRKIKMLWKTGELCVVFDQDLNNYFRGVIRSSNQDNYTVYLYDYGRELLINKKMIFQQDPYFQAKPCHVFKCRLTNIKPAGDAGKWSQLAVEILQKIFATYKTIQIKKIETNLEEKMLGVEMWYCLTTQSKALEPSQQKFISINKSLVECGVAFFVSIPPTPNETEKLTEAKKPKTEDWFELVCAAEMEDLQEMNAEFQKASEDEVCATIQETWPDVIKLQERTFEANLICIDKDGFFYVRDKHLQNLYRELEENLNSTFKSSQVKGITEENDWHSNDMCTIKYEGKWYRGTVLGLSQKGLTVEMIDFGSAHVVDKSDISKGIMHIEIPPLINKIRLYDVYSTYGNWTDRDVSEFLSLVTEQVKIEIIGDLKADAPLAEVYNYDGRNINDLITMRCPHMYRKQNKVILDSSDEIMIDSDNDSVVISNYCFMPIGNAKMTVVNVLKFEDVFKVVISSNDTSHSEQFQKLNNVIQHEAERQADLQNITVNTPCICFHPLKKLWCRATVYNVDSLKYGHILAFFVDYGSVEMISVFKLKEIQSEWLDLPVCMHIAIINIELLQNNQAEFVMMQLGQCRGSEVFVDVVSENPLKVHLYENQTFLCYQSLIDCGIIKKL